MQTIAPTDIAQFIRLDQCERYLRLRLHERTSGTNFMREYGVVPQSIPPILTRSGADFEQQIEQALASAGAIPHTPAQTPARGGAAHTRPSDNQLVLAQASALAPGEVRFLLQPRLEVDLDGWLVRGDADLLRIERDANGALHVLIADMKSSASAKLEHRLQVAFYHEMLDRLFARAGLVAEIATAILYRGPAADAGSGRPMTNDERPTNNALGGHSSLVAGSGRPPTTDEGSTSAAQVGPVGRWSLVVGQPTSEELLHAQQRALALRYFHTDAALLDIVSDPESYRESVRDLVTGPNSLAARVAQRPFAEVPFHLNYKCDGCLYNEYCMKWSAEQDDLSLLPHLSEHEKQALRRAGVTTTAQLAHLKEFAAPDGPELLPAPGSEPLVRQLAATWPLGPRLDELIHRARRYQSWQGQPLRALSYIPSKGYGSLPYCSPEQNANLVRIYIDAQHDYLHDRIYLLGALVVGCANGLPEPQRRRTVIALADGPPDSDAQEQQIFVTWIEALIRAVSEVAAPDAQGAAKAPIHLIFYNAFEQRLLLDGLARHFAAVLGATPLYDFITQIAAFDSATTTFLDAEIRELKNYPMVCQSLQAVAAYLRFDWNAGQPFRQLFNARLFDFWGRLDAPELADRWYTSRARFSSQLPLEYAYAAWGALAPPADGATDAFAPYRAATPALLQAFHARRLEAIEHIANDFAGNRQTQKTPFALPDLASFSGTARSLALALDEFITIERHVELAEWKRACLPPPERRVLAGDTLLVRYREADQPPELLDTLHENERRRVLRQQYNAAFLAANPTRKRATLTPVQRDSTEQLPLPAPYRLRLEMSGVECDLEQALLLTGIRPDDHLLLSPRWAVDERLPPEQQALFTPTPKQMLYATRAHLHTLSVERDAAGHALVAFAEVTLSASPIGGQKYRGFVFSGRALALEEQAIYSLDADPNSWYGYWCAAVVEELRAGAANTLYERLVDPSAARAPQPPEARAAQARFLAGIDALHAAAQQAGDPSGAPLFAGPVRDYIGGHGDTPTLLVQGPPGTGKSFTTAFALLARLQGAMATGLPMRVLVSCKTHAATDVLLEKLVQVQAHLRAWQTRYPQLFTAYLDARLLDVALMRANPRAGVPAGVLALPRKRDQASNTPKAREVIEAHHWCVVAATPGGIYGLLKDAYESVCGHAFCDCLVLDEASQMNLPEALLAAAPLKANGQLVVVGDHRQMPPIVKHDWSTEQRRTFSAYRAYESLFQTLLEQGPAQIKFAESFRLHADMAAFLRREIYAQDDIPFFSHRHTGLPAFAHADPFVAGVLSSNHPLIVVVHNEDSSQQRNPFEQRLIAPLLAALADPQTYALDPLEGVGVVVPHRAQRAALQEALPALLQYLPQAGLPARSAVDTVERFQGGERTAIVVSATESDRDYLRASAAFLLDPRRLNVALSRAKQKLILVASRSVFTLFSPDEQTFAHAQIWKNLLRRTCTQQLWAGEREGVEIEVWGNGEKGG